MSNSIFTDANRRHDFVILFDVTDGNPNGDPDNDNLPRTDPETGQGIVTDVCLKRKIRDYVTVIQGGADRFRIYVQKADVALLDKHEEAYKSLDLKSTGSKQKREDSQLAGLWMRNSFYDIRAFGAVMTLKINCGQVRGPMQMTFSRSIDRVFSHDITITRVAVTDPKNLEFAEGDDDKTKKKETEMGRKALVPYGLYMGYGFFNPMLAKPKAPDKLPKGVSQERADELEELARFNNEDLALFWEALEGMFELDRSASRGLMALRGLYIFTHDRPMGNAPAHKLFELIEPTLKSTVQVPRKFKDYAIDVEESGLPNGVTLTRLVG
ncbi:MAG: type I-C CRISPR-associated protein Cas7/Csd2 [Candidatus Hatepunaea meridiana]|nr:type I-C CRISPR-associated protein Cas7/Csd2 [Candidatus Hatepunaea meridiana]